MPIRNAGLTLLVLGSCVVILNSVSVKTSGCSRGDTLLSDISVETLAFSFYSKEHICTHKHSSCNSKYINTMMNLELLIVVFEH